MTYETWLSNIETLTNSNNVDILEQLLAEPANPNIAHLLEPKIEHLINIKLSNSVRKITRELNNIFLDPNYLDLTLVNFKKEIKFINRLCQLNVLYEDSKTRLAAKIKDETQKIYEILIKEADKVDPTGVLGMTIKNNQIK